MSGATAPSACTGYVRRGWSRSGSSSRNSGTTGSRRSSARQRSRKGRRMEASTETGVIEREISIAARPETIWDFLVDPMKATRWMGTEAFFDPRPVGEYRVEVISGEIAIGEFVELDRPRRLVFTWGWQEGSTSGVPAGSSTVEIDLVPERDGTTLCFRHSGL